MEYAGYNVVVVNLFDCCHCKHGEWGCTNARRDFWRTHSVEKRKEQIHAQETYWKWKSKINVFIGAGAYDDMEHHLLPDCGTQGKMANTYYNLMRKMWKGKELAVSLRW